ncbi:MAG TPA: glycosyltransferase family 2 protein [Planctomycetota bacterium]|nr:glycosyltransferase family 2 protein [Planctomycetota bacterium]
MKASVIVVNWNGKDMLRQNLPHVLALRAPPFETVVVDNGSTDGSTDMLRTEFPDVRVVPLPENLGFAGGNNAALPGARGELIATLNNDARPEPDWLARLVETADAHPEAGVFSSRLLVAGEDRIDSDGDLLDTAFRPSKRGAGRPPACASSPHEVFSACAGAALYRRSMIDRIGFFDEAFFLIYEDVDLSFRARLAGWKVLHVPDAVVHHAEGSSLDRVPDLRRYWEYRNLEYVWLKNMPARLILRHAPELAAARLLEAWAAWRRLGRRFPIYLRAKGHVLRNLPRLLRERRRLRRTRRVGPDEIARTLLPRPFLDAGRWREEVRRVLRW